MPVDTGKIRRLRLKAELTQEQAAKLAGFDAGRQQWNNVETGRQVPTIPTLERMAKALRVKARDLLK